MLSSTQRCKINVLKVLCETNLITLLYITKPVKSDRPAILVISGSDYWLVAVFSAAGPRVSNYLPMNLRQPDLKTFLVGQWDQSAV